MKVFKKASIDDLNWGLITERFASRFKCEVSAAKKSISRFNSSLVYPLCMYWYRHQLLSDVDNRIAATLGEILGADAVTLHIERELRLMFFSLTWSANVTFQPELREMGFPGYRGSCKIQEVFRAGALSITVDTFRKAVLLNILLFCIGTVFFLALSILFLYGISVLLLFSFHPAEVLHAVSSRGQMGLAFLCFLIGIAAVVGKAVRNIWGVMRWTKGRK